MKVWLYIESLGVCKNTLNKDHMWIDSHNKSHYQEHILIKEITNACVS